MNCLDGFEVYELIAQGTFSRDWTPLTQMYLPTESSDGYGRLQIARWKQLLA